MSKQIDGLMSRQINSNMGMFRDLCFQMESQKAVNFTRIYTMMALSKKIILN